VHHPPIERAPNITLKSFHFWISEGVDCHYCT
jgi:hypothetical protein